jgi:hypothetical protein
MGPSSDAAASFDVSRVSSSVLECPRRAAAFTMLSRIDARVMDSSNRTTGEMCREFGPDARVRPVAVACFPPVDPEINEPPNNQEIPT